MQYATAKYNQNEKKQWTYNSIGSETDNTKKIQNILVTSQIKLSRLLYKEPSRKPPQKYKKKIPNTTHHIGNAATRTATT